MSRICCVSCDRSFCGPCTSFSRAACSLSSRGFCNGPGCFKWRQIGLLAEPQDLRVRSLYARQAPARPTRSFPTRLRQFVACRYQCFVALSPSLSLCQAVISWNRDDLIPTSCLMAPIEKSKQRCIARTWMLQWKRYSEEEFFLKENWEQVDSLECSHLHRTSQLFLSVYVDDFKMEGREGGRERGGGGAKESLASLWRKL